MGKKNQKGKAKNTPRQPAAQQADVKGARHKRQARSQSTSSLAELTSQARSAAWPRSRRPPQQVIKGCCAQTGSNKAQAVWLDTLGGELASVGLRVNEVAADGNCFFRAVADQLVREMASVQLTYDGENTNAALGAAVAKQGVFSAG